MVSVVIRDVELEFPFSQWIARASTGHPFLSFAELKAQFPEQVFELLDATARVIPPTRG
jgi:hypothetical protein